MQYNKTNWKNGDIITQQKMNKIEQGIAHRDVIFIHYLDDEDRYDMTYEEMLDYIENDTLLILVKNTGTSFHFSFYYYCYMYGDVIKFQCIDGDAVTIGPVS